MPPQACIELKWRCLYNGSILYFRPRTHKRQLFMAAWELEPSAHHTQAVNVCFLIQSLYNRGFCSSTGSNAKQSISTTEDVQEQTEHLAFCSAVTVNQAGLIKIWRCTWFLSRYTTGNQPYNLPYNQHATSQIWALPSCPRSSHAATQPVAPSSAPSFLFTHLWIRHHGYGGEGWRLTEEHTSKKEVRDRDGEREKKRTRAEKWSHSGKANLVKKLEKKMGWKEGDDEWERMWQVRLSDRAVTSSSHWR